MTKALSSGADPGLDAGATRFQIRDGIRLINCNVSDEALEAVSGLTAPSTTALRRKSFDRFRTLINAAAKLKLKTLPPEFIGLLALTSRDLRRVPPETGVPLYGSAQRSVVPAAARVEIGTPNLHEA